MQEATFVVLAVSTKQVVLVMTGGGGQDVSRPLQQVAVLDSDLYSDVAN